MTRAKTATEPVGTLAQRMRQVITELNAEHIERSQALELMAICTLAKVHGYLKGDPGADKSRIVANWSARMGGNYRRVLMHRQVTEDALFGQYDVARYDKQGVWERDTVSTLADAHFALVDEIGRAGEVALDPLLTWASERKVKPGKTWLPAPLIAAFAASNSWLSGVPHLEAAWDRFPVRIEVHYIQESDNLATLLRTTVRRGLAAVPTATTIALDELLRAIELEVPTVGVEGVLAAVVELRFELFGAGIKVSDRRLLQAMRLLQATAWLAGRTEVVPDDLWVLRHVLWDQVEDIPTVNEKVLARLGEGTRQALELQTMLEDVHTKIDALLDQSLEAKASRGAMLKVEVDQVAALLQQATGDAEDAGADASRLLPLRQEVVRAKIRIFIECLGLPPASAAAAAAR